MLALVTANKRIVQVDNQRIGQPERVPDRPEQRDEPIPSRDVPGAGGRSLIEASLDPLVTIGPDGTITDSATAGSDAGGTKTRAEKDGDYYVLNGSKTFITNGPYADTIVLICKLDEPGVEAKDRKIVSFILDKGMPGLTQSKPFKKMGIGSSPTGELFLNDVHCGPERLMGGSEDGYGRSGAKGTFMQERAGVAALPADDVAQRPPHAPLAATGVRVPGGVGELAQDPLEVPARRGGGSGRVGRLSLVLAQRHQPRRRRAVQ